MERIITVGWYIEGVFPHELYQQTLANRGFNVVGLSQERTDASGLDAVVMYAMF